MSDDTNGDVPRFTREDFLLPPEGTVEARHRAFRWQLVLTCLTAFVAAVLAVATQWRAGSGRLIAEWADIYVIIGVLVPLTHLDLALRARKGRLIEVRHWTWLLFPVHLAWASGLLVAIPQAVPIGLGLGLLDLVVLHELAPLPEPE